jgi:hypothetical protein
VYRVKSPLHLLLRTSSGNHEDISMKRITINALVDIGCLITFVPSLITGLVLYLVLPSGGGRGNSYSLYLGITRTQWLTMHNYTSLVFAALLIIHLLLHWKFFRHVNKALNPKEKEECETS